MSWLTFLENIEELLQIGLIVCVIGLIVTAFTFPESERKLNFVVGWFLAVAGVATAFWLNGLALNFVMHEPMFDVVSDTLILLLVGGFWYAIRRCAIEGEVV